MTSPPVAAQQPYEHTEHGVHRPDPYHWMRRVDAPDLVAHLVAERLWYESATGHLSPLVKTLRSEMKDRVPTTDRSVSWRQQNCYYYTLLPAGREYTQLLRDFDLGGSRGTSQVLLDANLLADDSGYLELGLTAVSPDENLLAYSVDRTGDEVYELRFRDLESGEDLEDVVPRSYYGGAWSAASDHFFYTVHDDSYRPFQVWRHAIGTSYDGDVLVLDEPDERFELSVRSTRSGGLVVIWSESRDTREVWVLDAHQPLQPARSVGGRRPGVEYHAEHAILPDGEETLLVVTNDDAVEFRLARCPVPREADQDHTSWEPLRPEVPAERVYRVDAFATHVVIGFRSEGIHRLRVVPLGALDSPGFVIDPALPAGSVDQTHNQHFEATAVTVVDESWVHPPVWSDVDLQTGERTERHRHVAPGHDPGLYVSESRSFPAPDGTLVGATLVRHRDTPLDGTAPALIYAYGAYEAVDEPEWDPALPSLLDAGVVFVHAHVRGGGEGGRRWWLEGHLRHKQNTFTDHLAVADGVAGLVDGRRIATRGLSAGGLLQGAVLSQRPERWRAVVAEVPFVDVVTTMFDASIPLTITEWDEWGDPRRREEFDWMLSWSPYDHLPPAGSRPDLLVTGALHDPRVMVHEPAKWVAALRATDPAWSQRCVFRCETGAGAHTGPSGRFARLDYEAEIFAWLLHSLGLATDARISNG
ncbi:MAG: prolyl oligopeptidase family serine peptidase [Marmoricola sp.]